MTTGCTFFVVMTQCTLTRQPGCAVRVRKSPSIGTHSSKLATPPPSPDAAADELRVRSWVSQATVCRKVGRSDDAVALLRRAARAEPSVEEAYLKPLLAELAAEQQQQDGQQPAGVAGEDEDEQQQEARQQGEK